MVATIDLKSIGRKTVSVRVRLRLPMSQDLIALSNIELNHIMAEAVGYKVFAISTDFNGDPFPGSTNTPPYCTVAEWSLQYVKKYFNQIVWNPDGRLVGYRYDGPGVTVDDPTFARALTIAIIKAARLKAK